MSNTKWYSEVDTYPPLRLFKIRQGKVEPVYSIWCNEAQLGGTYADFFDAKKEAMKLEEAITSALYERGFML